MKHNLHVLPIVLTLVTMIMLSFFPTQPAQAASCYGAGCNGVDPDGTSCESDYYVASIRYASTMYNENRYSPSCNANWSYTRNTSATWLAAETVGVYTYHGDQPYRWVWNSMYDGSSTVCTKGHMGSSYMNYNLHTTSACA